MKWMLMTPQYHAIMLVLAIVVLVMLCRIGHRLKRLEWEILPPDKKELRELRVVPIDGDDAA
jgi:hypothetical protein